MNKSEELASCTLNEMWKFAADGLFCDVTLIAAEDKKKISAHRAVLCARNEFFRSMFCGKFREAKERKVTISEISGDILETLIKYLYKGTIDINKDNAKMILSHASIMLISEVVDMCSYFLKSVVDTANCFSMAKYAKLHNCQDLLECAELYMHVNLLNIASNDAFLNLSQDEVKEYLSSDELAIDNEKDVFEALMRWIDYDSETRLYALPELLSAIRFCRIEENYILEYKNEHYKHDSILFKEIKQNFFSAQYVSVRTGPKEDTIIVVCAKKIQYYYPAHDVVGFQIDIPFSFYNTYRVTFDGKKLFFLDWDVSYFFDLKARTWHKLPQMSDPRSDVAAEVLDNQLYVVGGQDGERFDSKKVEMYDLNYMTWEYVASMSFARTALCTAVCNGKLYAIGGKINGHSTDLVECYDPHTCKWSICKRMHTAQAYASAIVVDDEIFVINGINSSDECTGIEIYSPETDTWTQIDNTFDGSRDTGAYLFNNKIYLLSEHFLDEYDIFTGNFKSISTPNIHVASKPYCFPYLVKNVE